MRTRTRLAATAGLTILGGTALSGVAHAETGGLGLGGDLTTPVTRTVSGVVKTTDRTTRTVRKATAGTSSGTSRQSTGSGLHVNLPVGVHLSVRRTSVSAGVKASLGRAHVGASLGLCAGCSAPRPAPGSPPAPGQPNPPGQPTPPGSPPPGGQPPGSQPPGTQPPGSAPPVAQPPATRPPLPPLGVPTGRGELATIGAPRLPHLPYTGGPFGALAFLGVIAVATGAAAVISARPKARLSA